MADDSGALPNQGAPEDASQPGDVQADPDPASAEPVGEPETLAPLEDVERDLDTVEAALAALDSEDLEGAESLAAELESPEVEPGRDDGAAPAVQPGPPD